MDKNTDREDSAHVTWDYQPGDKVLQQKDGILHKTGRHYESDPWMITSIHTNGTIRLNTGQNLND